MITIKIKELGNEQIAVLAIEQNQDENIIIEIISQPKIDKESLEIEKEKLLKRLSEIDELLKAE